MSKAIKFIKAACAGIKSGFSRVNVPFDLVRDDPCGIEMISIPILTWTEQVAGTAAIKQERDVAETRIEQYKEELRWIDGCIISGFDCEEAIAFVKESNPTADRLIAVCHLKLKLDASADALRRIECLTLEAANLRSLEVVSHKDEIMLSVETHKLARNARTATQA